jgi:YVTN family beta-propeller protein
MRSHTRAAWRRALLSTAFFVTAGSALADIDTKTADNNGQLPLPTGQYVTPTFMSGAKLQFLNPQLANYPNFVAGIAATSAVSPDGNTLLVITNGYNSLNGPSGNTDPAASTQYVFVYDISGANSASPAVRQIIQVPNIYEGVVWASNTRFFVSGGVDDKVQRFTLSSGQFVNDATIMLGHAIGLGSCIEGSCQRPNASGIALSADGSTLYVANMFNDSLSIVSTATNTVVKEYDLRPGSTSGQSGVPGGEQPYDVAVVGSKVYVTSVRDREVVVLDASSVTNPTLVTRIKLKGAPNHVVLSADKTRLYVAEDVQDLAAVIDTTQATPALIEEIDTRAPPGVITTGTRYTGASPSSVALSPDGGTLYVTNGGSNSVAVIPLSGPAPHAVVALIPTAWFPQSVAFSADGANIYIVNGKSDQGPNPNNLFGDTAGLQYTRYPGGNQAAQTAANASNQYELQLHRSALVAAPVPKPSDYATLTAQVAANNFYSVPPVASDTATMNALHQKIQHVIYIIKENRTFDQVLGDLGNGSNGDASLAVFGKRITPNFHRIAAGFVTLDNFFDPGDASMNGWSWSTQAAATDQVEKAQQLNYAGRGLSYDTEGVMRDVAISLPLNPVPGHPEIPFRSIDPTLPVGAGSAGPANLLPGPANVSRMDRGAKFQGGTLWQAALDANLTIRNYGFWTFNNPAAPESVRNPYVNLTAAQRPVAFPLDLTLAPYTDVYYRGFDQCYPDVWNVEEWQRDLAANGLKNLTLLRIAHDHTGCYGSAVGGFNTPETQQADNDLAVGRVVQTIANNPAYSGNTLIFVVEDDPQDGPDHLDSHRSTAYVVGPYVKQHAIISTRYTTVNVIRTIEDILGFGYLNLNDALQRPMADVFDLTQASWTYTPVASTVLKSAQTAIEPADGHGAMVQFAEGPDVVPTHDAAWWENATRGFDFSAADRVPAALFNRVLWEGLMGDKPYPGSRPAEHSPNKEHASLSTSPNEQD